MFDVVDMVPVLQSLMNWKRSMTVIRLSVSVKKEEEYLRASIVLVVALAISSGDGATKTALQ
eukprot:10051229-Ditylum_brightwellii.AAC.1